MDLSLLLIAFTGLLAGTTHVLTGPDHLAAITPFATHQSGKSWKIGLWWGIGHTTSVWLIGILLFFLRKLFPLEGLSFWGEKLVGFMLIGVGLWGIQKAFRSHIHYHVHEHDGTRHAHFHIHKRHAEHYHQNEIHVHSHAPLSIGMLHGLAGSSHFLAILPALALSGANHAIPYVFAFGLGTILAMSGFSWMLGMIVQKFLVGFTKTYRWMQVGFSSVAIAVGIFWLMTT